MQKSNTNQIKHDTYLLKMSTLHFQNDNYGEQTHSATISFRVVIKFGNGKGESEHQPLFVCELVERAAHQRKIYLERSQMSAGLNRASLKGSANLLSPPSVSSFLFAAHKNSADRSNDKNRKCTGGVLAAEK